MTRLESLEPEFRAKIEQLMQAAKGVTGRDWVITAGRRTMEEQRKIYAQGRTLPGKVVSNAPPGSSAHNYGLAADLAPLVEGTKNTIDWGADKSMWKKMADIAKEQGLTPGYYFRTIFDAPHVEDPRWEAQRKLWREGKLEVA